MTQAGKYSNGLVDYIVDINGTELRARVLINGFKIAAISIDSDPNPNDFTHLETLFLAGYAE